MSNLVYSKDFTFGKYHHINEFDIRYFCSKQNDINEFKDDLKAIYYDTKNIKPNNGTQEKELEKRKAVINGASKLFDEL